MSDRKLSEDISRLTGEVASLKQEISTALGEFNNGYVTQALNRLQATIEPPKPKPLLHVLFFPSTASDLQTCCGVRRFGDTDVLVGTHEQAEGLIASDEYKPCDPCMKKRMIP